MASLSVRVSVVAAEQQLSKVNERRPAQATERTAFLRRLKAPGAETGRRSLWNRAGLGRAMLRNEFGSGFSPERHLTARFSA